MELQFAQAVHLSRTVSEEDWEMWQFIPTETDAVWLNGTRPLPPFYNSTLSIAAPQMEYLRSFLNQQFLSDLLSSDNSDEFLVYPLDYPANIPEVMANIAESITLYLRQENPNSTTASGAVWQQVTVIEIRWPWLILPVSIVCITAALLVAAVLSSKSDISAVRSWKSSSLPFLFHGIRDWSHDEWEALCGGEVESIKQMKAMAATMDVSLCKAVGSGTALTRHDLGADVSSQADRPTSAQEE